MSSWHSYGSLYNLGHRAVARLTDGPVIVQEKVDGSQFSFGKFEVLDDHHVMDGWTGDYELRIRSKGAVMNIDAPEKMFSKAAETVKGLADKLHPGWTYRGEYLRVPKHNTLAYDRHPVGHIILFDIATDEETYLDPESVRREAERLGLEAVTELHKGMVTLDQLRHIIDNTVSALGGQKIEGVVLKPLNYDIFGPDKKVLMGKFVSEAFKETHSKVWKENNPTNKDIVARVAEGLRTPARWAKAVQHLREAGQIQDSPRDIPALFKEVNQDILKEETEAIKEALFKHAWPHISRGVTAGLPEWYKEQLLKAQFENEEAA